MQGQLEKTEKREKRGKTERVYVKVTSDFDATGYMLPRTIIWTDGRIFRIDEVKDFRPACTFGNGRTGDCYTVVISLPNEAAVAAFSKDTFGQKDL